MDEEIKAVTGFIDALIQFGVQYGFQIFGAIVALIIGLKISSWAGNKVAKLAASRGIDPTLSKFSGNVVRLVLIASVVVITLGNFGITIAPLIALAGATAFGATMAIQGPLSNYGAGLSIILSRPFVVGNTITVRGVSGVVEDITLAATVLVGEDGELIRVPNKEVVGEVIVNSHEQRVVETKVAIAADTDVERASAVARQTLAGIEALIGMPAPQVGIHDFTYGGYVLGIRYWVPSRKYFQTRYAVNAALLDALKGAGVRLLTAGTTALAAPSLSSPELD